MSNKRQKLRQCPYCLCLVTETAPFRCLNERCIVYHKNSSEKKKDKE